MLFFKKGTFSLCATTVALSLAAQASPLFKPDFASAEHVYLGDKIKLYFSSKEAGQLYTPLHLPNGLKLTYGEILSFGDFYGVPGKAISLGNTIEERNKRFMDAFNSFAANVSAVSEANQILAVVHDEQIMLEEGLKRGETSEELYKKLGHEYDVKFNCITGGGCDPSTWFLTPGRYLELAKDDFDHFGQNAWVSYKTGHDLALAQAALAHKTSDVAKLELAYAMNAFACHFLSDRYAAGHIRTPRQELTDHVTPGTIGSLLSFYMHEEENVTGLHVHNLRGDHWIAYGDKSYFNPHTAKHRDLIEETLQISADQIFATYLQGTTPLNDEVYKLIPQPDETENASRLDVSPLFYWDSKSSQLMRRNDTTNLYDRHWTYNWWGWSTLIKLQAERGTLSSSAQASLALSGLGEQALQAGLITNKEVAAYVNRHPT